jgi:hypothetical protein
MEFGIRIKHYYNWYRLWVIQLAIDDREERYKVIAKNKSLVLSSNRPTFRTRGLKHRKPDWKLVDGKVETVSGLEAIIEAIMNHLEPPVKPG